MIQMTLSYATRIHVGTTLSILTGGRNELLNHKRDIPRSRKLGGITVIGLHGLRKCLNNLGVHFGRAPRSVEQRAKRIANASASFGRKSLMWNSYVDSLIPCPSRVLPNETTLNRIERAHRIAMLSDTAW